MGSPRTLFPRGVRGRPGSGLLPLPHDHFKQKKSTGNHFGQKSECEPVSNPLTPFSQDATESLQQRGVLETVVGKAVFLSGDLSRVWMHFSFPS